MLNGTPGLDGVIPGRREQSEACACWSDHARLDAAMPTPPEPLPLTPRRASTQHGVGHSQADLCREQLHVPLSARQGWWMAPVRPNGPAAPSAREGSPRDVFLAVVVCLPRVPPAAGSPTHRRVRLSPHGQAVPGHARPRGNDARPLGGGSLPQEPGARFPGWPGLHH